MAADPVSSGRTGNAMACLRGTRLVEARAWRLKGRADLQAFDEQVREAVREADGPILYADYRHASPVLPTVCRQWSRAMRRANGKVLRSGMLVSPGNILFNLQLDRMVECSHNPMRRIFTDRNELFAWLAAGCSPQDQRILRDVLGEPVDWPRRGD